MELAFAEGRTGLFALSEFFVKHYYCSIIGISSLELEALAPSLSADSQWEIAVDWNSCRDSDESTLVSDYADSSRERIWKSRFISISRHFSEAVGRLKDAVKSES